MSKYTAPIVILVLMTIFFTLWGLMYFRIFSGPEFPEIIRVVIILSAVAVTGLLATAFIQRIKEIKRGEEDDISKY